MSAPARTSSVRFGDARSGAARPGVARRVVALLAGVALLFGGAACSSGGSTGGGSGSQTSVSADAHSAPKRVTDTLAHIDAGDWPGAAHAPGTHGGDPFGNREKRLPATDSAGKKITYAEWDVNAKKKGQGRDAERIITGSDGSAWYTLDHYSHFTRIR